MRPLHTFLHRLAGGFALCLALAGGAGAATRDFYFERLGGERGLAQNTVNALAQDAQGFVWVGTQGGLHRYDGQRFIAYRHDPRDPAGLPDSYVTALAVEDSRALWVGSYSQYVSRLDLATGTIRRYGTAGGSHAQRQVMAVLPLGGVVWVGTLGGLERLDPKTGTRDRVITQDPQTLRANPVQTLAAGEDGGVWYGNAAGLYRVGPRGGVERMRPALAVRALARDHRGQLWIASSEGLYRLASDDRTLLRVWPAPGAPPSDVRAVVETGDRQLWLSLGTHGVLRLDPSTLDVLAVNRQAGVSSCLLYTSPSPRDLSTSRMPSSA